MLPESYLDEKNAGTGWSCLQKYEIPIESV